MNSYFVECYSILIITFNSVYSKYHRMSYRSINKSGFDLISNLYGLFISITNNLF